MHGFIIIIISSSSSSSILHSLFTFTNKLSIKLAVQFGIVSSIKNGHDAALHSGQKKGISPNAFCTFLMKNI